MWIAGREPKDRLFNNKKSWNRKQIGKLLLIITIADPEQFTDKGKPITYIRVFVELYNKKNGRQVHEIHGMVELKKMSALTAKHFRNLDTHRILEISSILRSAYIVLRNQERIVFYVNNYIDRDQFNQLYAPD